MVAGRSGGSLAWDGRDDQGHVVTPGIYFVTAASREARASLKVVRIP
jgi:hypothetical protein